MNLRSLRLGTLCFATLGALLWGQEAERANAPRVIVFVLFDTLGARHVSHLGYERETTPNLDALAADGVSFENAISPAPYAVASIPSLMTGRYPERHGMTGYERKLAPEEVTLAEQLSAAGYRSVGLSSVFNAGPHYGNDQGFARFVEMYEGPGPEGATRVQAKGRTLHYPTPAEFLAPLNEELERVRGGERLFLFIHFLQPHAPYDPPPEFLERFRDERFPGPYDPAQRARVIRQASSKSPGAEVVEGLAHLYDANLAFADDGLGRVIAALKRHELFEEALIIATGNHGEAFWEHGMNGHGVELHEELVHVPLVLKLPAQDAQRGVRRAQLVSSLDLMPTILERAHAALPHARLDGKSLLSLLASDSVAANHERLFLRSEPKQNAARKIGLRWDHSKVIVTLDESGRAAAAIELYDLNADPLEREDLAPAEPQRAARAADEALALYEQLRTRASQDD